MKPMVKIAWVMLMANMTTAEASALTEQPTYKSQALRVRLSAPARTPLVADQIRSVLSGKTLLLDEMAELAPHVIVDVSRLGGCPPVESFYPDGKWERGICARAYRVDHGHWSIKTGQFGSEICITIEGQNADCRAVWQRSASDRLILTVSMQRDSKPEYNPYITKPL